MIVSSFVAGAGSAIADEVDVPTPVIDYTFDDVAVGATTAVNSGSGGAALNGIIVGGGHLANGERNGESTLALPGGANGTPSAEMPYLKIPNGIYSGADGISVSTWVKWDGKYNSSSTAPWAFILGGDRLPNNNYGVFWTPSEGGHNTAVANDGREYKANTAAALPANEWTHLTITEDGSRIVLYANGVKVEERTAPIDFAKLHSENSTYSGLIGRVQWTEQFASYFGGQFDDFQVYDTALSADQVAELAGDAVTQTGIASSTIDVSAIAGAVPVLPATVPGTFSDGYERPVEVTWDPISADDYAQVGSFDVHGTAAGGYDVTAHVEVRLGNQVDIDFGDSTGEFMGGASGTLYGLYGQDIPSNNVIDGIKLRTVATKAQDGPQHPGADALDVLKPLVDSSNGDVYIYMTDIYRGFPYQWPGSTPEEKLNDFLSKIRTQAQQVASLPEKYREHVVFVPYNEPEGNMFGTGAWSYNGTSWLDNPQAFFDAWDRAYAVIKDELPEARIAGPNTSVLFDQVHGFMEHALEADTMPDVVTWHELSDPASIRRNVAKFRGWENDIYVDTAYEGEHLPINLNEYAFNYHTSVPGQMIQWVSALEDMKVDGDIAYWNIDGNLSDSAVQSNRGNGQWWLLNTYSNMTGDTVKLTPPHPDQSYTLQGVATLDADRKLGQVIIGGATGNSRVSLKNLDASVFGDSVQVTVKEIRWTGQLGDSGAPETVAQLAVPVVNGAAALSFGEGELPVLKEESAYIVTIEPGANAAADAGASILWRATYEAEDAAYTGAGYSRNGPEGSPSNVGGFYTSGGYDVGGLRTGSDMKLDFAVDVPEGGTYDLSVFANSLNTYDAVSEQGPTNVFVSVDGAAEQEIYLPLGYKWVVWDHADTTVDLSAGEHTVTLSTRSLDGSKSTKGDAIVDKIDLALASPDADIQYYEGELALFDGAQADYSRDDVSGAGAASLADGGAATFWVYADADAERSLNIAALGEGSATVAVNGQALGSIAGTETLPVFLQGGINKVVLTGDGGALLVDRIGVGASTGVLQSDVYQGEDAELAGDTQAADFSLATGGKALSGIGGEPGNGNAATFTVEAAKAGLHAVTIRYSNGEQAVASHYNPDPLARHASLSVNGDAPSTVWFPFTFHKNNFWEKTVVVDLRAGANTLRFSSEELPNFDGETYISDQYPSIDLRSQWAPNIDQIRVTSLLAAVVEAEPTVSLAVATRCVAGKQVLVTTVTNDGDETVSAEVETDFGSKTVSLAAGKSASQEFSTRLVSIDGGVASAAADAETVEAEYMAATCG